MADVFVEDLTALSSSLRCVLKFKLLFLRLYFGVDCAVALVYGVLATGALDGYAVVALFEC